MLLIINQCTQRAKKATLGSSLQQGKSVKIMMVIYLFIQKVHQMTK
jgi:hypothetical protein